MFYGNIPQNRERILIVGFLDENIAKNFSFPNKIPLIQGNLVGGLVKDNFIAYLLMDENQSEFFVETDTYYETDSNGVCRSFEGVNIQYFTRSIKQGEETLSVRYMVGSSMLPNSIDVDFSEMDGIYTDERYPNGIGFLKTKGHCLGESFV